MTTRITEMMLISTRRFVEKRAGHAAWGDVLGTLQPETRSAFARKLDPAQWVDFSIAADLLQAVQGRLGGAEQEVLHALGMHNAEDDLKATQRLLMRVLTVKMVLKIASVLWTSRVGQGGKLVVRGEGRTAAACRIEAPPDVSPYWWQYLAGWFQRTIEIAGGKHVDSRWTGGGDSAGQAATFFVSWE